MILLKHIVETDYQRKLEKLKKKNIQKEYKKKIRQERIKYFPKLKIETSKFLALYLFILLNAIVIYAMVAMWKFADLSYLGVLISDIAAQVLIYAIYCMKAYNAKKSEEELKFKRERFSDVIEAGAESKEYVSLTSGNVELFQTNIDDYGG